MERFFDSHECCKLIDDIEAYAKVGQSDSTKLNDLAERVILMQKEAIRIDKELGEPVINDIDSVDDIKVFIEHDTHNFRNYVESRGIDMFDYERSLMLI